MLAKMAGADFVKTSTGFGPSGATAHDVALMRRAVGPEMGVKASGGIRTLDDLQENGRGRRHAHRRQRQREDRGGHHRRSTRSGHGLLMATARPQIHRPLPRARRAARFSAGCRRRHVRDAGSRPLLANVAAIVKEVVPYDLFAILLYSERRGGLTHPLRHRPSRRGRAQPAASARRGHHRNRRRARASRSWSATFAAIRATSRLSTPCNRNWPCPCWRAASWWA